MKFKDLVVGKLYQSSKSCNMYGEAERPMFWPVNAKRAGFQLTNEEDLPANSPFVFLEAPYYSVSAKTVILKVLTANKICWIQTTESDIHPCS